MAELPVAKTEGLDKTPFVRKKKLQAELEHVTQEMYRRNLELAETNKTLSLLRTIDTLVLESHETTQTLCQQLAQSIGVGADFPFVGIFVKRPKAVHIELYGWYVTEASSQHLNKEALLHMQFDASGEWINTSAQNLIIEKNQLSTETLSQYFHVPGKKTMQSLANLNLQSIYIAKLMARQKLVGLMVIGMSSPQSEQHASGPSLLDRLGQAVGVAVDNRLLFEENQRVLGQLQKSNQKLKALDEAKDEFISMASHQLRTPLTSMKGYVSMVMEGDAGKPTAQQKKLLSQAFTSSQRMVYLVGDLLNVSRLKTGKFVIEPVATNLASVVEEEVQQLEETAHSRNLLLSYKKPRRFPTLMLDETKVRQVIMNFIDNAIYYTPAGGHIEAKLEDKGSSVEFTVEDNGLGVPKEEQPHLFSKFFRANNAKRARPDGTGLGLFMAKKVVAAQGGAIIFKSQEGKGSTFGFSFPKAKLAAKA